MFIGYSDWHCSCKMVSCRLPCLSEKSAQHNVAFMVAIDAGEGVVKGLLWLQFVCLEAV